MEPDKLKQLPKTSLIEVTKNLKCSRHEEPYMLVCIEQQCSADERLFCMECSDESHLGKQTHVLLSLKKFDKLYQQFGEFVCFDEGKAARQVSLAQLQKISSTRQKIEQSFDRLEKSISGDNPDFKEGEQEQIVKGKLHNILDKAVWKRIIEMQSAHLSEDEIINKINQGSEKMSQSVILLLNRLEKGLEELFEACQQNLEIKSLSKIRANSFSLTRKHQDIRITKDLRTATSLSEYGHYFALVEQPLTSQNNSIRFKLGNVSEDITYWIGFTFVRVSEQYKYTNIYDPKKGTYCVAIYDSGSKINYWSSQSLNKEEVKSERLTTGSEITVNLNGPSETITIKSSVGGKNYMIKMVKPEKLSGRGPIHPVVGFYGNTGSIMIL